MNDNKGELPFPPATPKPGDYPLHSAKSKAAAKMALKVRKESAEVFRIGIGIVGSPELDKPILVSRSEGPGGVIEIYPTTTCSWYPWNKARCSSLLPDIIVMTK